MRCAPEATRHELCSDDVVSGSCMESKVSVEQVLNEMF